MNKKGLRREVKRQQAQYARRDKLANNIKKPKKEYSVQKTYGREKLAWFSILWADMEVGRVKATKTGNKWLYSSYVSDGMTEFRNSQRAIGQPVEYAKLDSEKALELWRSACKN